MTRRRWFLGSVAVMSVVLGIMVGSTSRPHKITPWEMYEAGMVNGVRYEVSVGGLLLDPQLTDCAYRHSQQMAKRQTIYHSSDRDLKRCKAGWVEVGENVGNGGTLGYIFRAMLRSGSHRSNIVCDCFTRLGVGLVHKSGVWYVTQIFWRGSSRSGSAVVALNR